MSLFDLLPIPAGTEKPNAYEVFGLAKGEQDMNKITGAAIATIERLKSVKDHTDPQLWQQAATMVDHARQILADPQRKAALDAKLNIAKASSPSFGDVLAQRQGPTTDPLAGLLPVGDPLEPVSLAIHNSDSKSVDIPPGLFGTPGPAIELPRLTTTAVSPNSARRVPVLETVTASSKRKRRRQGSRFGNWVLGLLTAGLLVATSLLAYFVFYGPGTVQIVKSDDKIIVSTGREPDTGSVTADPRPVHPPDGSKPRRTQDPIMGDLAEPKSTADNPTFGQPSGITGEVMETAMETVDPEPMPIEPQEPVAPVTVDRPMMEESAQLNALENVRKLILASDWPKMKPAAETLTEMHLSDENKASAQSLFELVDLATYYREAIRRAVAELEVGNDFEVTDSFRVIVVETGEDRLTVRYNRKDRSFTLNEFPFSLAHKLATFQIPDSPTGHAAKAVYQALATQATDAHRDQAITWLREIDGEVEGANPKQLIKTIESIYQTAVK